MRTAAVCPTCATYENAVCVIYDGPTLSNINVPPLTNLQVALGSIDASIGSVIALINSLAANPFSLTTTGTSGPATLTGNVLNVPEYQPTLQEVLTNDNNTDQSIIITNGAGTISNTVNSGNIEIKDITNNIYTYYTKDYIYVYDQNTAGTSIVNFPDPNDNATFNFPSTGGTLAITSNITLQNVTSGTNKNLINELNFQGTGAGDNNTGTQDINGFGQDAAKNNTGALINALGRRAAQDNTGNSVNVFGIDSGNLNSGDYINGIGPNSLVNNSGDHVNAIGLFAGANNTFSYVNMLGYGASASANNQLVLSKDAGTFMARIGYGGITADRLYTLPDASGTIALTNTAWSLTGNTGTTAGTNFIGTTDSRDLVFKTNNTEVLRFNNVSSRADFTTSIFATTTAGAACQIWAQSGTGSNGYAIIGSNSTDKGLLRISNGVGSSTIKGGNLTGSKTLQLPNANGELVVSVNGVTPVNGNVTLPGITQQVKVSLTSANILSINSFNKFTLISAPGAGKIINIISVFFKYNFVTSGYSGAATLKLKYNNNNSDITQSSGVLSNVSNISEFEQFASPISSSAGFDNDFIVLTNDSLFSPTGGDSTLDVYITYSVVTL